jgi:hypothetical protein
VGADCGRAGGLATRLGLGATRATDFALGRAAAFGAAFDFSFGALLEPFVEALIALARALVLFFEAVLPRFVVAIGLPSFRSPVLHDRYL